VQPSVNAPLASDGSSALRAGGVGRQTQASSRSSGVVPKPPTSSTGFAATSAAEPNSSEPPPAKPAVAPPGGESKASSLPDLAAASSTGLRRSSISPPAGLFTSNPAIKPSMESTEPDRERSSPSSPSALSSQLGVSPPAGGGPLLSGAPASGMLATRLVPLKQESSGFNQPFGSAGGGLRLSDSDMPHMHGTIEPLALNLQSGASAASKPVRRWPALALLGLAVVAFGGVIVVRAPGLLPPPLAAMLGRSDPPAQLPESPAVAQGPQAPAPLSAPPEAAIQQPAADVAPTAAPDAPAEATEPTGTTTPAPQIAVANVAGVQGGSAELEKQAIELLLANDYRAAYSVYERLRAAEPARPEYGVMLELLSRELTPTCGGPGQPGCAAQ
jgi:hypothetical protein